MYEEIALSLMLTYYMLISEFGHIKTYICYTCIYVTGNVCNQGFYVIPNQVREFT
jgi:hypothetical protein